MAINNFHLNHWWSGYTTPTEIFTTFHNNQQYQSPIPIKTSWESAKPARNICSELILENERHTRVSKMSSELLPTSSYLSGKITLNISPHGTYSSMCFFCFSEVPLRALEFHPVPLLSCHLGYWWKQRGKQQKTRVETSERLDISKMQKLSVDVHLRQNHLIMLFEQLPVCTILSYGRTISHHEQSNTMTDSKKRSLFLVSSNQPVLLQNLSLTSPFTIGLLSGRSEGNSDNLKRNMSHGPIRCHDAQQSCDWNLSKKRWVFCETNSTGWGFAMTSLWNLCSFKLPV